MNGMILGFRKSSCKGLIDENLHKSLREDISKCLLVKILGYNLRNDTAE